MLEALVEFSEQDLAQTLLLMVLLLLAVLMDCMPLMPFDAMFRLWKGNAIMRYMNGKIGKPKRSRRMLVGTAESTREDDRKTWTIWLQVNEYGDGTTRLARRR
jgi:hypothetical protein